MEELTGTVEKFLFKNEENGFCVFVLQINQSTQTTVRGYVPGLHDGQRVELKGSWTFHPKFGKQFESQQFSIAVPTSVIGLKKYLGSGMIKGIGKVYGEKLVNHFGVDVLTIIDKNPERLAEVPGIGTKRVEGIIKAWRDQKEISTIMVFLQEKGASTSFATKIYKHYGKESIAIMTENPYRIAEDIWGIGFKTADAIAQNIGFEKHSIKRIKAGLLFSISQQTANGHLYAELEHLKKITLELLELVQDYNEHDLAKTLKIALHELYDQEKIKLITCENKHFVTLPQFYFTERSVAARVINLNNFESPKKFNIQQIYQELRVERKGEISLNELQQEGIINCLQHKITVITGGPGTGKTTLIKKLLSTLKEQSVIYKLTAPTGRAAKRMTESTGNYAVTIHRLLEFNPQNMGFMHNEKNSLKLDFLIVDEASMIDIFLAHAILKAVPLTAHIVFIGDIDQLPSVGAGNFLHDLIESKKVPVTRLNFIFRQAENSLISYNAHRINNGEFPVSNAPSSLKDFSLIKEDNVENLNEHLKNIFQKKLFQLHLNIQSATVLTPMNRGSAGTHSINHYLQLLLNPSDQPTIMYRGTAFKVKDRVMQIKNNYDKNVFNGDIGFIESIDLEDKIIKVQYPENVVPYEFLELDELVLAYALSIHKSQGSEFDTVIIPLFTQHFTLLQRNLIYTALTRAKKFCFIIGQTRAIAIAINNTKGTERITFLNKFLTTDLACRS